MSTQVPIGRAMSILVHSDTKVGKSTFGATAPKPMLLLDAEAAHRFLDPQWRKVFWNPLTEAPPTCEDGSWDICVVIVRQYADVMQVDAWLRSGQHCFRSVVMDSVSEVQKKCVDQIAGNDQMDQRKWGDLLRHMEGLIRGWRDLTEHPTNPVEAIVLTAMTTLREGKWRPYVQGQLATTMPYFLDVIGYMFVQEIPNEDPTQAPHKVRRMLVSKNNQFEAGERVQGRLGEVVEQEDINVERMLDRVFGPRQPAAVAAPVQS